jgi:hypothetical protein
MDKKEMTIEEVAACVPKGRVVWLDVFDTESCCQKDSLVSVSGAPGGDGSWVLTFVRAPEEFIKGMGFCPMRCQTCGRYWFKVWKKNGETKGIWTVK